MVREINLNHICKIEGHAHLSLKIEKNKVTECELKAAEGARFFEALVLGKKIQDIQAIVSRICGICSSAHTVACVQALENALDIKPSENQIAIRELLMIGERIRSHATHLYFMALPDYFNYSSALEMTKKHKEKIQDALRLIKLGNKIVEYFGGREIHPFLKIKEKTPEKDKELINELKEIKKTIKKTIKLFKELKYPEITRKTEYLSLKDKDYATISGEITSYSGFHIKDYKKYIKEEIKEYATSKFALKDDEPINVGAIARINNNLNKLDKETTDSIKGIKFPLENPFQNNLAQAIELLHLTNKAVSIIKNLKDNNEKTDFKIKQGHGFSAVEAPRGTLFHEYTIDNQGKISYCNIITPTVQNLAMMETDIKTLTNKLLEKNTSKQTIIRDI